ncbi:MAG: AI-2E family transporter [Clostridium butyricum]|nr:AI-2E family transporter [Clostridium butyricum]
MKVLKYKNLLLKAVIIMVSLGIILLYIFNASIKKIFNIITASLIIAYVFIPARKFLERKIKISRSKASILIILILLGIFVSSILIIVPSLFNEAENISKMIENLSGFMQETMDKSGMKRIPIINNMYNSILERGNDFINNYSRQSINDLIKKSGDIISYAVCPIMIYYLLSDGKEIYEKIMLLFPTRKRSVAKKVLLDIDRVLSRYIVSQLLLCGIISILTFTLLIAFKVKFPFWISLLNGVFNIIPYFGPILGIIPAAVSALIDSPMKCIYTIIGMLVIQQIEGNILSPMITSKSIEMHPFAIIVLLLIGDELGGFIGMVLVIPIAVIIKVLYDDINYYLF